MSWERKWKDGYGLEHGPHEISFVKGEAEYDVVPHLFLCAHLVI